MKNVSTFIAVILLLLVGFVYTSPGNNQTASQGLVFAMTANDEDKDDDTDLENTAENVGEAVEEGVEEIGEGLGELGENISDTAISASVKLKLRDDDLVTADHINVDVRDGVVVLRGTVSSQEELDRAVSIAQKTEGVKTVRSELRIQ